MMRVHHVSDPIDLHPQLRASFCKLAAAFRLRISSKGCRHWDFQVQWCDAIGRGPKDHIDIRILQRMISGIPGILILGTRT